MPINKKTNSLAIASMVLGIYSIVGVFILGIIPGIFAIIFGFIAKGKIRNAVSSEDGYGMALAGIIMGFIGVGLFAIAITAYILFWLSLPQIFSGLKDFIKPFE
jgi:hypothetical protein